ncbi:MAG TPA: hypothetical protein VK596_01115, partial [Edaphobacter sp.]|nr:hypothetical protein [Edaphobacter sp.]
SSSRRTYRYGIILHRAYSVLHPTPCDLKRDRWVSGLHQIKDIKQSSSKEMLLADSDRVCGWNERLENEGME